MKFDGTLIVVEDMERSRRFYEDIFEMKVEMDHGANVAYDSGLSLQTRESWEMFTGLGKDAFRYGGNVMELYFTHDDLEPLEARLDSMGVDFVHRAIEMPWVQKAMRFYDPDGHMIEVGESMEHTIRRLAESGLSRDEVQKRTTMPMEFIDFVLG